MTGSTAVTVEGNQLVDCDATFSASQSTCIYRAQTKRGLEMISQPKISDVLPEVLVDSTSEQLVRCYKPLITRIQTPRQMFESKRTIWTPPNKYAEFAKDALVAAWLEDYKASTSKTEHVKRLGRLVAAIGMSPAEIIDQVKQGNGKAVKDQVKKFCKNLAEDEGKTAMASLILSSFRSFLDSHEVANLVNWSKKDVIGIVAVRTNRRVPKKEDIYRLVEGIEASSLGKERIARHKAMIWTAFQSGVRPSALLSLRIKDVDIRTEAPVPIKITPQIDHKITRPLSKIGYYWTFVGEESKQAIREYLALRETEGQKLTPESYLFENFHYRNGKIGLIAWNKMVTGFAKYGGFKKGEISAHSFRHATRKQVRLFVDDQVGAVLLGHLIKGAEEAYFDRKDMDALRGQYAKVDWKREKSLTQSEVLEAVAASTEELNHRDERIAKLEKELAGKIRKVEEFILWQEGRAAAGAQRAEDEPVEATIEEITYDTVRGERRY